MNEPVTQGLCALHYAVWQKNIAAINLLMVRGADINKIDDCGYSALHLAAEHGYFEICKILLDAGANVDYREPTDEIFPRTTLCDEPLRLALRNKHYVRQAKVNYISNVFDLHTCCCRMLLDCSLNVEPIPTNATSLVLK